MEDNLDTNRTTDRMSSLQMQLTNRTLGGVIKESVNKGFGDVKKVGDRRLTSILAVKTAEDTVPGETAKLRADVGVQSIISINSVKSK